MRRHMLLCAFIAAIAAPAAQAQPAGEPTTRSVTVRLDDLDLASATDGATALRRVRQAAWLACGGSKGSSQLLTLSREFRRCRAAAVETAVARAATPSISRAHAETPRAGLTLARR
jgi:UrcA family protein